MEKNGVTEEEFCASVRNYASNAFSNGDWREAGRAISLLSNRSNTNTVPYLLDVVLHQKETECPEQVYYVLGRHANNEVYAFMAEQWKKETPFEFRKNFYEGCFFRISEDVRHPDHYTMFQDREWYGFLMDRLHDEPSLKLRISIDSDFEAKLKGWKYSAQRVDLLRDWEKEAEGTLSESVIKRERMIATHSITNDRVLCEYRGLREWSGVETNQQEVFSSPLEVFDLYIPDLDGLENASIKVTGKPAQDSLEEIVSNEKQKEQGAP